MVAWLEPAAVAAAVGAVVAAGLALGWRVAGERAEVVRWCRRAAGSGLMAAVLLGLRLLPGAAAPMAPAAPPAAGLAAVTPRQLDPAAAADTRAFLRTRYRPLLEELGPLLDRYLADPADLPPVESAAAAAQVAAVAADRAALGALRDQLAALAPPGPAAALVERTGAVVNGLLLVAEQDHLALTGRARPPAERAARRQWLAETSVEPWLAELLTVTAASGAGGDGDI